MENNQSRKIKDNLKKTIIISSYDDLNNPDYGGGGARAVHEAAKRMAGQFEVTVLTSYYPGAINEIIDQVKYKRIGSYWLGARMSQLIFNLVLPYYCLKEKFDIWLESFTPPYSTACLPLFTKRPVIGLVHQLSGRAMKRKYLLPFNLIERIGLSLYHNFIVPHQAVADYILSIVKDARVQIIENGINPDEYQPDGHEKKFITYIGRIECEQKGIGLLIDAYKMCQRQTAYPLVIAGGGIKSERKKLEKLIEQSGLTDKIKILGKLKHRQVLELLDQSLILAVPSRFETFPLAVLEALASGVPVVCFDIDGLNWLPVNVGIKVKPFEVESLAHAMVSLTNNNSLRQNLGVTAKKFSRNYSWDKVGKKYLDYLNDFICKKY